MSNVTEQEMGTLLSIISRCDDVQLARAVDMVRHRRVVINNLAIQTVKVGAKVKWNGKHGAKSGIVLRVKQKYVEVKEDVSGFGVGMTWNVPAIMLKASP